jgi:hypothetical protein
MVYMCWLPGGRAVERADIILSLYVSASRMHLNFLCVGQYPGRYAEGSRPFALD